MGVMKDPSDKSRRGEYAQYSILAAIPAMLVVAPGLGFLGGQWLDEKLSSDPWFTIFGVFLGFGAAGVEIANLIKKAQSLEKKKDVKDNNGT